MNQMEIRKKQWRLITGILGFVIIILLGRLVGDLGVAYLAISLECFALLELLFVDMLPDCMERLIRSRMAKGQYKNADKVFASAMGYGCVTGVIGSLLLFFLAGAITKLLKVPEASLVLRLLAPMFLLCAVSAVLKGYFQGIGTAMPTIIAGILQQIFTISFAALFGHLLYGYGEKAAALLHNDKFAAMYGAIGIVCGYLLAALLAFCFLLLVYIGAGRRARNRAREGMRLTEDGIELLRLLLWAMVPAALVRFLCRGTILLGYGVFRSMQTDIISGLNAFGAFYGKYLMLAGIVILLALLLCVRVEYTVVYAIKKEEYKNAKNCLTGGIQAIFLFAGFIGMLFFVLAPGLLQLFLGADDVVAVSCMQQGFLVLLLFPMGIFFVHILEGMGRRQWAVIATAASVLVSAMVLILTMKQTTGSVLSFVYALLAFGAVLSLAAGILLFKMLRSSIDLLHVFVFPTLALGITGLCIMLLNKALVSLTGEIFATILCTMTGAICYLVLLLVLRCVTERDLCVMPGGKMLRKVGNLLHIF